MLKLQLYHEMYYVPTPPLAELDAALRARPADPKTYHLRGVANFQAFEFQAAARDFSRAVELTPDFADAIFHRGIVHVVRGRYDNAMEDFNRVIAVQPNHAAAYYNRGRLHYWRSDYQAAITNFKKARKHDPLLGRELNLRHVIGELQCDPEDNSVLTLIQRMVERLMDL